MRVVLKVIILTDDPISPTRFGTSIGIFLILRKF